MNLRRSSEYTRNRRELIHIRRLSCTLCGESRVSELTCDHIVPLAEGGTHDLSNLQVLCTNCHKHKTAKQVNALPYEQAQRIRAIKSSAGMRWWRYRRSHE